MSTTWSEGIGQDTWAQWMAGYQEYVILLLARFPIVEEPRFLGARPCESCGATCPPGIPTHIPSSWWQCPRCVAAKSAVSAVHDWLEKNHPLSESGFDLVRDAFTEAGQKMRGRVNTTRAPRQPPRQRLARGAP